MGTGELLGKPDEMLVGGGGSLVMDWHPIQGSYYPSCFLLRKQGQAPAGGGGGTRLKYSLFLLPKTVSLISQGTSKLF